MPAGVSIERVDWLPSGARSGLVRVRGRRAEGEPTELPVLALTRPGAPPQRFASLPDPGLVAEVEALRAEVARLAATPEPEPAPAPLPAADPVVLREALTATVAVVADLRLQLHKAQLARRSREVGWSADAVKLIVFE